MCVAGTVGDVGEPGVGLGDEEEVVTGTVGSLGGAKCGIGNGTGFGDGAGIEDGLGIELGIGILVGIVIAPLDGVPLGGGVSNGEGFGLFGDEGILGELIDEVDEVMVGSFVGEAEGIHGGIGPGDGDSIAVGLGVVTVVVGSLFKLGKGISDLAGVVDSSVGLGVGASDGIRLGFGGVGGVACGIGVGTVVAGSLGRSNGGSVI